MEKDTNKIIDPPPEQEGSKDTKGTDTGSGCQAEERPRTLAGHLTWEETTTLVVAAGLAIIVLCLILPQLVLALLGIGMLAFGAYVPEHLHRHKLTGKENILVVALFFWGTHFIFGAIIFTGRHIPATLYYAVDTTMAGLGLLYSSRYRRIRHMMMRLIGRQDKTGPEEDKEGSHKDL